MRRKISAAEGYHEKKQSDDSERPWIED